MPLRNSILCFAHQRWHQHWPAAETPLPSRSRTQSLLRWCARERPVAYFEPPRFDASTPALELTRDDTGVLVAVPHLVPDTAQVNSMAALRRMVDRVLGELGESPPVLWYATPMAVDYGGHLDPAAVVYDCSWELETFVAASLEARARERWLLTQADLVFTDCHSLHQHKRRTTRHPNIHPLLASVDFDHFGAAREQPPEPADQADIASPRIGYCGEIDDSVDLALLTELAAARPDLQLVMLGPIRLANLRALPQAPNLHWLGAKPHEQIPAYLAGWEVGMLPLVRGASVGSLPPCKPAEYLAAGKPLVSTSNPDVVEPYGRAGLVWLGDGAGEFADAIDEALASDRTARIAHADSYLFDHSWPEIWAQTRTQVLRAIEGRSGPLSVAPSRATPSVEARSDRRAVAAQSTTIAAKPTTIAAQSTTVAAKPTTIAAQSTTIAARPTRIVVRDVER
jgi:glycosyltransferase involved in cell wall biosynthesis